MDFRSAGPSEGLEPDPKLVWRHLDWLDWPFDVAPLQLFLDLLLAFFCTGEKTLLTIRSSSLPKALGAQLGVLHAGTTCRSVRHLFTSILHDAGCRWSARTRPLALAGCVVTCRAQMG